VKLLCRLAPGGGEAEFRDMGEPAQALTLGPMPRRERDPARAAGSVPRHADTSTLVGQQGSRITDMAEQAQITNGSMVELVDYLERRG
jgi:hypothetical protein